MRYGAQHLHAIELDAMVSLHYLCSCMRQGVRAPISIYKN